MYEKNSTIAYKIIHGGVNAVPTECLEPTGVRTFAQRMFPKPIRAPSLQALMSLTK